MGLLEETNDESRIGEAFRFRHLEGHQPAVRKATRTKGRGHGTLPCHVEKLEASEAAADFQWSLLKGYRLDGSGVVVGSIHD
jgi:hypothetical protein